MSKKKCHWESARYLFRILSIRYLTSIVDFLESDNKDSGKIAGIVVGSVIGGLLLLICACALCMAVTGACYSIRGNPFRSNKTYVRTGFRMQNEMSDAIFRPGSFSGSFFKDGTWHGSEQFTLAFYPQANQTLYGKGTDEKGPFIVNGTFSPRTLRMAFDKQYQAGSTDAARRPGTKSTIQLEYNPVTQNFEGKYYSKMGKERHEERYVMKVRGANHIHL